jgi:hypothetical protein
MNVPEEAELVTAAVEANIKYKREEDKYQNNNFESEEDADYLNQVYLFDIKCSIKKMIF